MKTIAIIILIVAIVGAGYWLMRGQEAHPAVQLCSNSGEVVFEAEDGTQSTFHKAAGSVSRCEGGDIWRASEDGREVTEAGTFYFDQNGAFLGMCQLLFPQYQEICERYEDISCEEKNYCEE